MDHLSETRSGENAEIRPDDLNHVYTNKVRDGRLRTHSESSLLSVYRIRAKLITNPGRTAEQST
jgi:hypothetical protein